MYLNHPLSLGELPLKSKTVFKLLLDECVAAIGLVYCNLSSVNNNNLRSLSFPVWLNNYHSFYLFYKMFYLQKGPEKFWFDRIPKSRTDHLIQLNCDLEAKSRDSSDFKSKSRVKLSECLWIYNEVSANIRVINACLVLLIMPLTYAMQN